MEEFLVEILGAMDRIAGGTAPDQLLGLGIDDVENQGALFVAVDFRPVSSPSASGAVAVAIMSNIDLVPGSDVKSHQNEKIKIMLDRTTPLWYNSIVIPK